MAFALTSSPYYAEFSPCRTWRYTHEVVWGDGPRVAYLCFNPSTADESQLDNTLRRCRGFAQRWGYGSMVILNLFGIRGTDPRTPSSVPDPVGPRNDYWTLQALGKCDELICAWGCGQWMKGELSARPARIVGLIRLRYPHLPVNCLGYRADGHPRHPLMLGYDVQREMFKVRA